MEDIRSIPILESVRPFWMEINLAALSRNLHLVRGACNPQSRVIAPVNADPYGHGVVGNAIAVERLGVDAVATKHVLRTVRTVEDRNVVHFSSDAGPQRRTSFSKNYKGLFVYK